MSFALSVRAPQAGAAAQGEVLWRGMRSVRAQAEFLARGGTELAFMSTTRDLGLALGYALSAHSLVFRILAPDFMSRGAELGWLSAFPDEHEVLYPPLVYLQPTGRTERVEVDRPEGRVGIVFVELTAKIP